MPAITIDIPDERYNGLLQAAAREKKTPAEWIIAHLPTPARTFSGTRTMYDVMAPYLGQVSSGPDQSSSSNIRDPFGEYLEEKRRNGTL